MKSVSACLCDCMYNGYIYEYLLNFHVDRLGRESLPPCNRP